jgi:hypothetical protein
MAGIIRTANRLTGADTLRRGGRIPAFNRGEGLPVDQFFSSVELLLPMTGANNSTTFTDVSGFARTVTAAADAKISTAQSKFYDSSGALDGTGDRLSVTTQAMGTGDFTIEGWIRPTGSFVDYRVLYDTRTGDADLSGFVWGINSIGQLFVYHGTFVLTTGTLALNAWQHVALTRASGTWRIFVDGLLESGSYGSSADLTRTAVRIGMDFATLYGYNGNMQEWRITRGIARYTTTFAPPIAAFPRA